MFKRKLIKGFTLVEIMIVVAIIALLAAIAVPGFLRARKRSQASTVLNDARVLDGAVNQWMLENNASEWTAGDDIADITGYFKSGTRFYRGENLDVIGNTYTISSNGNVVVSDDSIAFFNDVIDNADKFWAGYNQ
jgi:prepilin-type N-terminal cleavage/methylation domain-containing protein